MALRDFTDLLALSIASVESRARPRRLAEQQASLRRVATLVAEGAAPQTVLTAVAEEVVRIFDVSAATVVRYEPDETSVVVAEVNHSGFPVGTRWPLDDGNLATAVRDTGRPARIDDFSEQAGPAAAAAREAGIESGIGVPIIVDGRVWGMVAVGRRRRREALPSFTGSYTGRIVLATETAEEIEKRLADFTELVATAISNTTARAELIASRARIVEAADETRRRIQRDLRRSAAESRAHDDHAQDGAGGARRRPWSCRGPRRRGARARQTREYGPAGALARDPPVGAQPRPGRCRRNAGVSCATAGVRRHAG
jgi:GAF domain-containing protein